jgi:hypothetical protein
MTNGVTRVRYTLRIPADLYDGIGHLASRSGISINALVLHILWDWLDQQQKVGKSTRIVL